MISEFSMREEPDDEGGEVAVGDSAGDVEELRPDVDRTHFGEGVEWRGPERQPLWTEWWSLSQSATAICVAIACLAITLTWRPSAL
jgi:hypothetical protein